MKKLMLFGFLLAVLALAAAALAEEKAYAPGSVWEITFVRTEYGMGEDYLTNLAANWKTVMEEYKKEGLVLSYVILWGEAANEDDWDMLLMVEYKNYAVFDIPAEKWEEIEDRVLGTEETQQAGQEKRAKLREILGGKTMREYILK